MMRNMMIERFKVAGHVQDAERDGFALVIERSGGRLGPHPRSPNWIAPEQTVLDAAGGWRRGGLIS